MQLDECKKVYKSLANFIFSHFISNFTNILSLGLFNTLQNKGWLDMVCSDAGDALQMHFSDVDDFLKEMYLHFWNSQQEWSVVFKLGNKMGIGVMTQPKSFGTR